MNRIWLLTKLLGWQQVDVSIEAVRRAGGTIAYYGDARITMNEVFAANDEGIRTMKMWCQQHCYKWRYEPSQSFFFRRSTDAVHFKLRWC